MGQRMPNITSAELRMMKVLWDIAPATVRDVKDALASQTGDPPAYTTVMTLMNQLAAKGALEVDKARQPFVYEPAIQREQVLHDRLKQFLHTVYDGQAGELVMRLVEDADLSAEDLRRIEAKIEGKDWPRGRGAKGASRRKTKASRRQAGRGRSVEGEQQ